jgi:hypothetical protein
MMPRGLFKGTDVAHHVDPPRQRFARSFDFVCSSPGRVRFSVPVSVIQRRGHVTGNIDRFWRGKFLGQWRGTDDLSNPDGGVGCCRHDLSGT